jgi:hypothetical protein
MNKNINFYQKNNRWYADLPEYLLLGGTEEECEMVAGADVWLSQIAEGEKKISLSLSTEYKEGWEKLHKIDEDEYGAVYLIHSFPMWLCPVTKFVFGSYPENIYYKLTK